jgi:hypothetical protein
LRPSVGVVRAAFATVRSTAAAPATGARPAAAPPLAGALWRCAWPGPLPSGACRPAGWPAPSWRRLVGGRCRRGCRPAAPRLGPAPAAAPAPPAPRLARLARVLPRPARLAGYAHCGPGGRAASGPLVVCRGLCGGAGDTPRAAPPPAAVPHPTPPAALSPWPTARPMLWHHQCASCAPDTPGTGWAPEASRVGWLPLIRRRSTACGGPPGAPGPPPGDHVSLGGRRPIHRRPLRARPPVAQRPCLPSRVSPLGRDRARCRHPARARPRHSASTPSLAGAGPRRPRVAAACQSRPPPHGAAVARSQRPVSGLGDSNAGAMVRRCWSEPAQRRPGRAPRLHWRCVLGAGRRHGSTRDEGIGNV